VVADAGRVETLIPRGTDPHEYQASAAQTARVRQADLVVANGLGLEEGLANVLDAAAAADVPVLELALRLDPISNDPHFWLDPLRMADGQVELEPFQEHVDRGEVTVLCREAVGHRTDLLDDTERGVVLGLQPLSECDIGRLHRDAVHRPGQDCAKGESDASTSMASCSTAPAAGGRSPAEAAAIATRDSPCRPGPPAARCASNAGR
jgi:hypothetical protein